MKNFSSKYLLPGIYYRELYSLELLINSVWYKIITIYKVVNRFYCRCIFKIKLSFFFPSMLSKCSVLECNNKSCNFAESNILVGIINWVPSVGRKITLFGRCNDFRFYSIKIRGIRMYQRHRSNLKSSTTDSQGWPYLKLLSSGAHRIQVPIIQMLLSCWRLIWVYLLNY